MEVGGKGNATIFSTIQSKTLDHRHQHEINKPQALSGTNPYPDGQEPDNDPDPDPTPLSTSPPSPPPRKVAKKATQKQRSGGEHTARYIECQKNHAAASGGHVVDGCCEFMPTGQEGTPEALKCAACECHRSFHRKEMESQNLSTPHLYDCHRTTSKHQIPPALYYDSYNILRSHAAHPTAEIARKSSSSEDTQQRFSQNHHYQYFRADIVKNSEKGRKKKRFRTKISQEQKEKMKEFADKIGWRMQKKDEEEVDTFCSQVNLKRQVFKVWMHNIKQAMKRNNNLEN